MQTFAKRQASTLPAAPSGLLAGRGLGGSVGRSQAPAGGAPHAGRAARGVEAEAETRRAASEGFDLTRVPVTPPSVLRGPADDSRADAREREADEAADKVMTAAAPVGAVPRLSRVSAPLIQRAPATPKPAAPAPTPTPTRVTGSDEYERYQATQEDIERFKSGAPYFLHNYRPSTGRGFFDAMYYPPNLHIGVKVRFNFADSDLDYWKDYKPDAKPGDVTWTQAEKESWRQRYLTDVSAKWTSEKFTLFCTRRGWEGLSAQVAVRFADVEKSAPPELGLGKGDVKPHFDLLIKKIPPGQQLQALTLPPGGTSPDEGRVNLDSEGLTSRRNETGHSQRSAVHESGHMLGLGDTYAGTKAVGHGALAEKELGVVVPIQDDGRLMSRGEEVGSADAVTFLEAMRKTTNMQEWSLTPKPGARPPYPPERINDAVPPRETVA